MHPIKPKASLLLWSAAWACCLLTAPLWAQQAARLGAELTPVGAEKAGNKDGTIPAWSGGDVTAPGGYKAGQPRPNPYAADKPVASISAANLDKYAAKLSPGQVQLIKSIKGYRMDVYPTHRSCGYPDVVYQRSKENVGFAKIGQNGYELVEAKTAGYPFPMPANGVEAMWNFKMRYQGEGLTWAYATAIPPKGGSGIGEPLIQEDYIMFPLSNPKNNTIAGAKGVESLYLSPYIAPAQFAGDVTLSHAYIGKTNDIWLYFASQRRVRRAPTYSYDAPILNDENLETIDQYTMYNGPLDRYDYKLVGKKEMIVPYNWNKVNAVENKIGDVVQPTFLNRDLTRYETHRVWEIEATVKQGARHTFPKRTFYLDEDSWQILVQDLYDGQGKVQRVMESGVVMATELPACVQEGYASYDLSLGRYIAERIPAGQKQSDWLAGREGRVKESMFEPDGLRRFATR